MHNILIRRLSIEDASISFQWRNDPEIWQYTGNRPNQFITEEIEKNWLDEKLRETNSCRFAIIVDNKYIGNIQITDIIERDKGQYHIFIGEKSFWNKGIAKQATDQIIRFAKEKLYLKEIYLFVNSKHIAALKLYEKCGFFKVNDEIKMCLNLLNTKNPVISVFVITYNHEQYIAQALEGILIQKTNFDFDIVVGEDCSSDNTRKIVMKYASKYPGKFKLLLHEHNIGAHANQLSVLQACTGKYIAICEGDDYWTDPYKLQKQVDFLETNKDFAICSHSMQTIYEGDDNEPDLSVQNVQKDISSIEDLAQGNIHIYTASCVFRNGLIEKFPDWFYQTPAGDYSLHMLNAQYGKIKSLPDIMGVYRVHRAGLWSNNTTINKHEITAKVLFLMLNHFAPPINTILAKRYRYLCIDLIKYFKNNEEKCKFYSLRLIETNPFFINEVLDEFNLNIKEISDSSSYKLGRMIINPLRIVKHLFFK